MIDSPGGNATVALPEAEYHAIFRKVPRLTVEVVICSELGVLLVRRIGGPCDGLWNLPGGTVRFAEPATDAVHRVALDEIGADVTIDDFLGYIEYPSHTRLGLDWPVGLAFRTHRAPPEGDGLAISPDRLDWFTRLPDEMHDEQRAFLRAHRLVG
ncbi:MAG: NUDIX domain-containing protein [Acidimicrobiales bacterium]|nr:NUDIX domain-containing protein [Acidimicrobiales bacterium]